MSETEALEPAIAELRDLLKRKPLKDQDQARARQLMSQLRSSGYTSMEIAGLTGWSAPTVKLCTRSTTVQDPGLKKNATQLLGDLISQGPTLSRRNSSRHE
ncbi:MAG TPA: hypothetical protein VJ574_01035 [Candidatus Bathyarchaeia archaeon]|nr:hypothetical protein [Candidatus Bathyarchaeia archaeon]